METSPPDPAEFESLVFALRSLVPVTWVTTHDAPRWLSAIKPRLSRLKCKVCQPFVENGLLMLNSYPAETSYKSPGNVDPLTVLQHVLGAAIGTDQQIVFLPHVKATDEVVNLVRQIVDRTVANDRWITMLVFLNAEPPPEKLQALIGKPIVDKGPTPSDVHDYMTSCFSRLTLSTVEVGPIVDLMRGLSFHQILTLTSQALILAKLSGNIRDVNVEHFHALRPKLKGAYE